MSDQQTLRDVLFELTMQKKWEEVVQIYAGDSSAHKMKLTKCEDTAFHIAICSHNSKSPNASHEHWTKQMVHWMKEKASLSDVLKMKNVKGDTPLHLAAAVGWEAICIQIAGDREELIEQRNVDGETPLFVAAHHGNLEAFYSLHSIYNKGRDKPDESLCRRKDGNTVLHCAISGEYFRLASLIIDYYKNLVNYFNVDGETPVHVLARKPNVFRSSSQLGFYESIVYKCVFVDDLKQSKHTPSATQNEKFPENVKFPENYRTCANFFSLFWNPIYKSYRAGLSRSEKRNSSSKDEENQPYVHGVRINERFLADCSGSKKRSDIPTDENAENQTRVAKEKKKYDGSFPPNYTTCISIFKFASTVILTILGIGFFRIRKIQEKKAQHCDAMELMNKMIEPEPSYKYDSNGQRPVQEQNPHHTGVSTVPDIPPNVEEQEAHPSPDVANMGTTSSTKDEQNDDNSNNNKRDQNQSGNSGLSPVFGCFVELRNKGAVQNQSGNSGLSTVFGCFAELRNKGVVQNQSGDKTSNIVVKDTPLLVAAKMGIPEMVKKIISAVPVAIQDEDSEGKNVLMLAAENRQTSVFEFLLQTNLPDYVFHHVDHGGNSILHLAAKLGEKQPWRIPGAALQMQWEIKWYKHVKSSVPRQCFSLHNAKGETPRKIFTQTHENLVKSGNEWLIKTSESCSVVAALIATVAFATSATVPGGLNQERGYPILKDHDAFDIFSIASLLALCLSITALVFFLAIITSRFEERDFKRKLPRKLLLGLTCLFSSIAAMLLSFCAGHTFILREKLRIAVVPIYAAATIPVTFFAMEQLPLYFDLLRAACRKVPLRSYKVFHQ